MGYRLVGCETLITYFGKVPISEHSMGGKLCVVSQEMEGDGERKV